MTIGYLTGVLAFNIATPQHANLAGGSYYAIVVTNMTTADITAGTVTISGADALPDDMCAPGPFAPLEVIPDCDAPMGTASSPATVTFSPEAPLKAGSSCSYAIPCPRQFIQSSAPPAGAEVIAVVKLARTA